MSLGAVWRFRNRLGADGRRRVRRIVDAVISPVVGSVRSSRSGDRVAITLDDGPDPSVTPGILASLAAAGARCTFFLLVDQCRLHSDLVETIVAAGHEVALHGEDHRRITGLSHGAATRYLRTARHDLQMLSGTRVKYYRPPYGAQSLRSYLAVRRAGMQVVVWSADAADWVDRPMPAVVESAFAQLGAGGILLLHERLEPDAERGAWPTTSFDRVDLVRQTMLGVAVRGWRAVSVGDLITTDGARRTAWFRP